MAQTREVRGVATSVFASHGTTRVNYRGTTVVEFDAESIRLNTGGWKTVTTKTRMNQAANQFGLGFSVFAKDFEWWVKIDGSEGQGPDKSWPFTGEVFTIARNV